MREVIDIIGKSVKSSQDNVMYEGFPNSDQIHILPAGRPSPEITSYLPSGYFQVDGSELGLETDLYIEDSEKAGIVDPGSTDESSLLSRLNSSIFSVYYNTSRGVQKKTDYLEAGAKKAFTDLKYTGFDIAKYANQILVMVAVVLGLWLLNKLIP